MSHQPEPEPSEQPEAKDLPAAAEEPAQVAEQPAEQPAEAALSSGDSAEGEPEDRGRSGPRPPASRSEMLARRAAQQGRSSAPAATPEASTPIYQVVLPTFEGPLDLLLHLIQQHELDIRDIPIAFISEKYVEYIMLMQGLNIDLASEYLVMAATLAHIKSKMLLPAPPQDQEDDPDNDADPRAELVRRLLEYQKYRYAAEELGSAPVLGRDVFTRGAPAPSVEGPAPLAQVSVFKLLDAFQTVLKRIKQTAEHHIDVDRISISDRINELTDLLRGKERVAFDELFPETMTRSDLVVTFLALLEMTRLRMTRVFQEGPLEPIYVELSLTNDEEEAESQEPLDLSAETTDSE